MLKRLLPPLALVGLGLLFFADLVAHPTRVLYSDHSDILAQHIPAKRFLVGSWQQTGEVKCQWNRREQKKEGHVSELIKSQKQEEPRKQPRFQRNSIGAWVAELEPDKYEDIDDAGNASRHAHVLVIGQPLADIGLHEVTDGGR